MSAGFVWGVDPGLSRIAFAFADCDSDSIEVSTLITHTVEREGARLGLLDRQLRIFARQWAETYPPEVAWIEQPSGRWANLGLTYAVGVMQAALFETLAVPVWTIPSSTWKARTTGRGNATKPQIAAWVERRGWAFDGQDEADAIGVAAAGRAMLGAGSWEAVA